MIKQFIIAIGFIFSAAHAQAQDEQIFVGSTKGYEYFLNLPVELSNDTGTIFGVFNMKEKTSGLTVRLLVFDFPPEDCARGYGYLYLSEFALHFDKDPTRVTDPERSEWDKRGRRITDRMADRMCLYYSQSK